MELAQPEDICVSTDDLEAIAMTQEMGIKVPFVRPAELATDTSGSYEVLLHALQFYEDKGVFYDTLVLMQATSPFRKTSHVKEALKLYNENTDMVISAKESSANPYFTLYEKSDEGYLVKSKTGNFVRRQDCPDVYELNGAIYIMRVEELKKTHFMNFKKIVPYLMDDISSLDIDTPLDWYFAECILNNAEFNPLSK